MSGPNATTPIQIGAYLGNPDISDPANEAIFASNVSAFTALMGNAPTYLDSFIDQTQPIVDWVGNSNWAAHSFAASPDARTTTPVIALPMISTAAGALTPDQTFQAFSAGQYDSELQGIVDGWASNGFSNLVIRPGWEMNITGPAYAGSDAKSQADWVAAFQHIYTALHQDAAAAGINVQVMWNPSTTNYSLAEATANLYPGNNYVDMIGADAYADINPYSDGGAAPTYHDWHTGQEDASVAQFLADPVNRAHYWSYPAATMWSNDGSGGHSLSLDNLLQFAEQQGKPFGIPETGAGHSSNGTDVTDDPAYAQWLAQDLAAAQAGGEKIQFVNLWDSNGGGNYEFSKPTDGKPLEAASWAQYFGAGQHLAAPDMLDLHVSEDAWQGDAQFTVAINGQTIAGVYTATASHAAGATQDIQIAGSWGAGQKTIGISFINDAYGGSPAQDRNLYVDQVTYDGQAASGAPASLYRNGTTSFTTPAATTLTLNLAEDAWQGNALFAIAIDGRTVQSGAVTASNAQGQSQAVNLQEFLTSGTHDVSVSFLNDAYGGTPAMDRNLYVKSIGVNGATLPGSTASLFTNGTDHFQLVVP